MKKQRFHCEKGEADFQKNVNLVIENSPTLLFSLFYHNFSNFSENTFLLFLNKSKTFAVIFIRRFRNHRCIQKGSELNEMKIYNYTLKILLLLIVIFTSIFLTTNTLQTNPTYATSSGGGGSSGGAGVTREYVEINGKWYERRGNHCEVNGKWILCTSKYS